MNKQNNKSISSKLFTYTGIIVKRIAILAVLLFVVFASGCATENSESGKPQIQKEQTPFYSLLNIDEEEGRKDAVLHGKVGEVSELPDPITAPYEDCFFAVEFFPKETDFLKTILLFPGFENRIIIQQSTLIKQGISIKANVLPFDQLPEAMQLIQQANELNDFDSEVYYVESFEIIEDIGQIRQLIHRSAVNIIPPEKNESADAMREARLKQEKERIEKLVADNDGFEQWRKKDTINLILNESKDTAKNQITANNILFSYYRPIFARFNRIPSAINLIKGLSALNHFLKQNGIHLIVLVWPQPEEVAADLFFPEIVQEDQYLDVFRVQIMQEMLNNDIEIVDLLPPLKKQRFNYPPLLFQAHLFDSHPASGASRIAGEEVASILKRYSFIESDESYELIEIPMRKGREYEDKKEIAVSWNGTEYKFDNKADILFAGDSFAYHPQNASSVGAFCGYYLHQKVGLHARSGGAPRLFRTLLQEHQTNGLLNRKKVVVLSILPSWDQNWEIPVGFPDFKDETFEVLKQFSPSNKFEGITACLIDSGEKLDFSAGRIIDSENTKNKDIKLDLPNLESEPHNCVLRISTADAGYFLVSFIESDSKEVYTNGAAGGNEELLIQIQKGKDMSLIIPSRVSVLDISYLKKID